MKLCVDRVGFSSLGPEAYAFYCSLPGTALYSTRQISSWKIKPKYEVLHRTFRFQVSCNTNPAGHVVISNLEERSPKYNPRHTRDGHASRDDTPHHGDVIHLLLDPHLFYQMAFFMLATCPSSKEPRHGLR